MNNLWASADCLWASFFQTDIASVSFQYTLPLVDLLEVALLVRVKCTLQPSRDRGIDFSTHSNARQVAATFSSQQLGSDFSLVLVSINISNFMSKCTILFASPADTIGRKTIVLVSISNSSSFGQYPPPQNMGKKSAKYIWNLDDVPLCTFNGPFALQSEE